MIDPIKNFARVTVAGLHDNTDTVIPLESGEASKLPEGEFNLVWFDNTNFSSPTDDPNREIVRVTGISDDELTVTRGQEGTSASNKNTPGSTYTMIQAFTEKIRNDIEDEIDAKTDQTEFDNHSARHEDGGDDEINVTGLSGELADPQPPQEHDNDAHSEDFATLDGAETLINKTISNYTTANSETIDLENLGSAETIDFDTNSSFRGTLNDDVTLTFSNVSNGQRGTITLYFSGSQRTITVAGANPPVGGLPDAPSSADEVLILTVWNDGTNTFIVGQLFDVS